MNPYHSAAGCKVLTEAGRLITDNSKEHRRDKWH